jgi:hypothetical protein
MARARRPAWASSRSCCVVVAARLAADIRVGASGIVDAMRLVCVVLLPFALGCGTAPSEADGGASDGGAGDVAPESSPADAGPDVAPPVDAGPNACATALWPGPTNTGVPPGTTLKPWDGHTIVAGETLDSWDIPTALDIQVPNVTIVRCHVHGNDTNDNAIGVKNDSGGLLTVVDSEIDTFSTGIGFDDWHATRVNIHDTGDDPTKLGNDVTLEDSWVHADTVTPGAHQDCGQMQNGVVDLVIRHNHLDSCSNSALFITPDLGPSTDGPVTIDDNCVGGGNYTVHILDGNNQQYYVQNISLTNNRFMKPTGQYGPTDINVPVTESGNVWDDTLQPVQ